MITDGKQTYYINVIDGYDTGATPDRIKLKNGKVDNNWMQSVNGGYGNIQFCIAQANYDTTGVYEITYLALNQYSLSSNVQTINGEYDSNMKMILDRNVQNQADINTRVSVMENNKARKVQGQ